MTDKGTKEIVTYSMKRLEHQIRFFVDLPGVLDPDLDIEIVEKQIIVRAQRTLPESKMIFCKIPLTVSISEQDLQFYFECGVLEIVLVESEDLI